jgi:hypothetical protein
MALATGRGHRCTPDLCVCPATLAPGLTCGSQLTWLPHTYRHSCRECHWHEPIQRVDDVDTDLL